MDQLQQVIHWLTAEIDYRGRYHDHKETMAWLATAFYLPAIAAAAYYLTRTGWNRGGITVLILLAALTILFFVSMQFRMRWNANDTVVGLHRARAAAWGQFPQFTPAQLDAEFQLEPDEPAPPDQLPLIWPAFVLSQINAARKHSKRGPSQFASALYHFLRLRWDMVPNPLKTELASYLAAIAATATALALVWTIHP